MADPNPRAVPRLVIGTPAAESDGRFSPDGRWTAYLSNETGRFQVYVQAASSAERRWQVSVEGGEGPVWRRDGPALFPRTMWHRTVGGFYS
ncbi:MAG TPA: hypothetical protein VES67_16625 [Vicinamibacterales bacterium]|nr:hypothetical protein [Vicinamibacterales bacterium]